jgi:ABC-type protease/lipase transport system fused ATPase/permease subunit
MPHLIACPKNRNRDNTAQLMLWRQERKSDDGRLRLCKSKVVLDIFRLLSYKLVMIQREITQELLEAAREYPVVTVIGPRQSGKTTLVRMAFPDKPYFSFEDPDIRLTADADPRGFLL